MIGIVCNIVTNVSYTWLIVFRSGRCTMIGVVCNMVTNVSYTWLIVFRSGRCTMIGVVCNIVTNDLLFSDLGGVQ